MPYDVCPERPGVVVPDLGGVIIDCCPREGSTASEGLIGRSPRLELGVSDDLHPCRELFKNQEERPIIVRLEKSLMLCKGLSNCKCKNGSAKVPNISPLVQRH